MGLSMGRPGDPFESLAHVYSMGQPHKWPGPDGRQYCIRFTVHEHPMGNTADGQPKNSRSTAHRQPTGINPLTVRGQPADRPRASHG